MGTKFIVHGGISQIQLEEGNAGFYMELLKDIPESARVLLVPFAKEMDRIPAGVKRVSAELEKHKWQNAISIEVANDTDFMEQLAKADAVFFLGGASLKLLEALRIYPDLRTALEGKTVAGESAGANVLSTFFYSPKVDKVSEGLGILPIKLIPHYKSEYKGKLDKVGANIENLELAEYAYKVFSQEVHYSWQ